MTNNDLKHEIPGNVYNINSLHIFFFTLSRHTHTLSSSVVNLDLVSFDTYSLQMQQLKGKIAGHIRTKSNEHGNLY